MTVGGYVLTQVSRTDSGLTTYAHKPEGSIDPLAEELVWTEDPDDSPLGYERYMMSVSTSGTRGSVGQGPWGQCYICRYDYPVSQMVKHKGRFYCREQKCNEDLI